MLCAVSIAAQASTVKTAIDGMYFELDTDARTAKIINGAYNNPNILLKGDCVIPPAVSYNGVSYTVTAIGEYTFGGQESPDLTSVTIPTTVTTLDRYAFDGTEVPHLIIPHSVTTIGNDCFGYSYLQTIGIGRGIESIGDKAFFRCTALTQVTMAREEPPTISATTFPADVKKNVTLVVRPGCAAKYKAAPNWSGFKAYVEDSTVGTEGIETAQPHGPARYFNIQGMEITTPADGQLIIELHGGKATKRIFKSN